MTSVPMFWMLLSLQVLSFSFYSKPASVIVHAFQSREDSEIHIGN